GLLEEGGNGSPFAADAVVALEDHPNERVGMLVFVNATWSSAICLAHRAQDDFQTARRVPCRRVFQHVRWNTSSRLSRVRHPSCRSGPSSASLADNLNS